MKDYWQPERQALRPTQLGAETVARGQEKHQQGRLVVVVFDWLAADYLAALPTPLLFKLITDTLAKRDNHFFALILVMTTLNSACLTRNCLDR